MYEGRRWGMKGVPIGVMGLLVLAGFIVSNGPGHAQDGRAI